MSNALALTEMPIENAAAAMVKSGYFQDTREVSQAIVKILAGREMGFGPFASMTGVYIISGRPALSASLMATAVKRSGKYDYRVMTMTELACEIAFFQGKDEIGRSKFTADDARKAGTKNMEKFPKNMLFARAMSNGVRWYCPDVFTAGPVYTPEELGAAVNDDGEMIDASVRDVTPQPEAPAELTLETAKAMEVTDKNGKKHTIGSLPAASLEAIIKNGANEETKTAARLVLDSLKAQAQA